MCARSVQSLNQGTLDLSQINVNCDLNFKKSDCVMIQIKKSVLI